MNLEIEKWKEFKIGNLFDVQLSKGDIKLDEMTIGTIPLVSSGETNNGIVGYIDSNGDGKAEVFTRNTITLDMFGNAFYQERAFFAVSHGRVNILFPRFELNKYIGIFICQIICMERYKYSYGRAVYSNVASDIIIKLPVLENSNGTPVIDESKKYSDDGFIPDWQFMEDYIKSLHHKPITTKRANEPPVDLNVEKWEDFKIENLFSKIYKAKAHTKEEVIEADIGIHFISRTEENNGMDIVVENDNLEGIEKGNCITIGDTTATCFYQKDEFITGDHMVVLRSDWMNQSSGLFIVTELNLEKYRYCYGRAFKMDSIKSTCLKLPIQRDEQGKPIIDDKNKYHPKGFIPDWKFMEDYINTLPFSDRI